MNVSELTTNEYDPYYITYLSKVGSCTIDDGLHTNGTEVVSFLESIPNQKYDFRYAEDKWTLKEVLQHIIDTERIFTYRALCIARGDKTAFPGYEQDDYVAAGNANALSVEELINDFKAVRSASISLFKSLSDSMLTQIGTASNSPISPRAIAFILIGHANHHCEIIKERYL